MPGDNQDIWFREGQNVSATNLHPPPSLSFSGGGGVTWPTPKCCCWSLGPCLQGPCVVRHCHLYPLHFGGTLCIAFCEMEPDSTTICTPGTSTDVHPLHRGTRSGTRRWMLCYFIFRCNFCAPYCACTVVVATSPGELRGDRLPWMGGGGRVGMSPWCIVLVCSRQRLLADHHSLPFPWTLSLYRRWYPSATHRPVSFLPPLGLSFPLYFPFLSLGRLCQRSPRTFPVSLLCVRSTRRRATALAVGQVRPSGHPKPTVRDPSPTAAFGPGMSTCGVFP